MIGEILASPGFAAICSIITCGILAYLCVDMWLYNRKNKP